MLAIYFGASPAVDAYVAARTFPELLMNLVFAGVLGYAVIPIFLKARASESEDEGWRVASAILSLFLIVVTAVVGAGLLFSEQVISLFAPGLSGTTKELAIHLNWILLPTVVFAVFAGISGALLNALGDFLRPALNGVIVNLMIIACVLLFAGRWGVSAAAAGTMLGAVLQVVQLIPALRSKGFVYKPQLSWKSPLVQRAVVITVPILLLQSLIYGRILVARLLASNLPPGSLAILNYADRLASLPVLIFANSLNTVAFTALSEAAVAVNLGRLKQALGANIRMIAITVVPSSLLLTFFASRIVRLVYERGAFDAQTSMTTASVLTWSALGLFLMALMISLCQAFFALQDVKTPLVAVLAGTVVNALGSYFLAAEFGIAGLGMGATLGVGFSAILLGVLLHIRIHGLVDSALARYLGKVFIAATGANVLVLALSAVITSYLPSSWENSAMYSILLFAIVCGLYGLALWFLRVEEVAIFVRPFRRLFPISRS